MLDRNAETMVAPADDRLSDLYRKIAESHARVEVAPPDGDGQCVIISKEELQNLERALEILADSEGMKAACLSIEKLCDLCRQQMRQ